MVTARVCIGVRTTNKSVQLTQGSAQAQLSVLFGLDSIYCHCICTNTEQRNVVIQSNKM